MSRKPPEEAPETGLVALAGRKKDKGINASQQNIKKRPSVSIDSTSVDALRALSSLGEQLPFSSDTPAPPTKRSKPGDSSGFDEPERANEISASLVSTSDVALLNEIVNRCLQGLLTDPYNHQYYLALIYTCKIKPELFGIPAVMQNLIAYMLTENNASSHNFNHNSTVPILVSHLVFRALQMLKPEADWPVDIVGAFLDDALGPRLWVDHESLRPFVECILRAFPPVTNTNLTSPNHFVDQHLRDSIDGYINSTVVQHHMSLSPHLRRSDLKTWTALLGYSSIRRAIAERLITILTEDKVGSREILSVLCSMTKTNHEDDISAMLSLAFAVLETGSLPSTMVEDVSKMIGSNPQYSGIAFNSYIRERVFGAQHGQPKVLQYLFDAIPAGRRDYYIAGAIIELASDYSVMTNFAAGVRFIVRSLLSKISFAKLFDALCTLPDREAIQDLDYWSNCMVEALCVVMVAMLPPLLEGPVPQSAAAKREREAVKQGYRANLSISQSRAIRWCYELAEMKQGYMDPIISRLLLLDPPASYPFHGTWDQAIWNAAEELPVGQDALALLILLAKKQMLHPNVFRFVEVVAKRAALMQRDSQQLEPFEAFVINTEELVPEAGKPLHFVLWDTATELARAADSAFGTATVSEGILASACKIMSLMAAYRPSDFGREVWSAFSNVRAMMERFIMGHLDEQQPQQSTMLADDPFGADDVIMDTGIGSHMDPFAAEDETVLTMASSGVGDSMQVEQSDNHPSEPPADALPSAFPSLRGMDDTFAIGTRLITSRDPDFIIDMIQSGNKSLDWLRDVISRDHRIVDVLPLNALAQLLMELHSSGYDITYKLVGVLSGAVRENLPLVELFLSKLASPNVADRVNAKLALQALFSSRPFHWLESLCDPKIDSPMRALFITRLSEAIIVDSDEDSVETYASFLVGLVSASQFFELFVKGSSMLEEGALRRVVSRNTSFLSIITQTLESYFTEGHPATTSSSSLVTLTNVAAKVELVLTLNVLESTLKLIPHIDVESSLFAKVARALFGVSNASEVVTVASAAMEDGSNVDFLTRAVLYSFVHSSSLLLIRIGLSKLPLDELLEIFSGAGFALSNDEGEEWLSALDAKTSQKSAQLPDISADVAFACVDIIDMLQESGVQSGTQLKTKLSETNTAALQNRIAQQRLVDAILKGDNGTGGSVADHDMIVDDSTSTRANEVKTKHELFVLLNSTIFGFVWMRVSILLLVVRSRVSTSQVNDTAFQELLDVLYEHDNSKSVVEILHSADAKNWTSAIEFCVKFYREMDQILSVIHICVLATGDSPLASLYAAVLQRIEKELSEQSSAPSFLVSLIRQMMLDLPGNDKIDSAGQQLFELPGEALLHTIESSSVIMFDNNLIDVVERLAAALNEQPTFVQSQRLSQCLMKCLKAIGSHKPPNAENNMVAVLQVLDRTLGRNSTLNEKSATQLVASCLEAACLSSPGLASLGLFDRVFSRSAHPSLALVRPFVMATMLHKTPYKFRESASLRILNHPRAYQEFDAPSAIQFLVGHLYHPMSWATFITSEESSDPPAPAGLRITRSHLTQLVSLCLAEVQASQANSDKSIDELVRSRKAFLVGCAKQNKDFLKFIIESLAQKVFGDSNASSWFDSIVPQLPGSRNAFNLVGVRNSELRAAKAFLDQFYADHPWETFSCAPKVASELHESPAFISQIDAKLHRLIKTLFIAPPEVKRNSYFAIRKLACIHPSMVVRHLKTLGSVLKARHSKNVTQLVASGEVLLFTFTIEILNVLRPLAFDCSEDLGEILGEFADVILDITFYKELSEVVDKLSMFLLHYVTKLGLEPSQRQEPISRILSQAQRLQEAYKSPRLDQLVGVVRGQVQPSDATRELSLNLEEVKNLLNQLDFPPLATFLSESGSDMQTKTKRLEGLRDLVFMLEKISSGSPIILRPFIGAMLPLMAWSGAALARYSNAFNNAGQLAFLNHLISQIRISSFQMAGRFVNDAPTESARIIATFMDCLRSGNDDVKMTAVEQSIMFFQIAPMPEQQTDILHALSRIGAPAQQQMTECVSVFMQTL